MCSEQSEARQKWVRLFLSKKLKDEADIMGTLNWQVDGYAPGVQSIASLDDAAGAGAFTTSTTAATVTGVTLAAGSVLTLTASEDMWVRGGGNTAAVGIGKFLPAGVPQNFGVTYATAGALSAIDVA